MGAISKDPGITVKEFPRLPCRSLMVKKNLAVINASTRIIIVPGYKFRMIKE